MKSKPKSAWNSRAVLWPCKDCGRDVSPVRRGYRETWGVKDALWKSAGMKSSDFLCTECLRKRLGRPLTFGDYIYIWHSASSEQGGIARLATRPPASPIVGDRGLAGRAQGSGATGNSLNSGTRKRKGRSVFRSVVRLSTNLLSQLASIMMITSLRRIAVAPRAIKAKAGAPYFGAVH